MGICLAEPVTLPIWKKNATAYERLSELALLAREHPERFERFCIVYLETLSNGRWKFKTFEHNANLIEALGMYQIAVLHEYEDSKP